MIIKYKAISYCPRDVKNSTILADCLADAALFIVENTIGISNFKVEHNEFTEMFYVFLPNTNSSLGVIQPLLVHS